MHRYSAVAAASLLAFALSGCFGSLKKASKDALQLETAMHQQMANGDFAGIYSSADQRYRDAIERDKSDALFASIQRKLGSPQGCEQGNTFLNVTTNGTTIRSVCKTNFSKNASAVETFTWIGSDGSYKLLGYNINSNELIER
jgi:hypothetical protein